MQKSRIYCRICQNTTLNGDGAWSEYGMLAVLQRLGVAYSLQRRRSELSLLAVMCRRS